MSYATYPADEAEVNVLYYKIEKLDNDLKKREVHLAELIDEVVYAEDNKDRAVRRAEAGRYLVLQLEQLLHDLLGYLKVIEGNILLPAFLDLFSVIPQEPVMNRALLNETFDKISEDTLTSRTKKLISSARDIPSKTKNRATREAFMRTVTEESVNVEDAIVLSGLLLEKKDELTSLLDDLRDRIINVLQGNRSDSINEIGSRSVSAIRNNLSSDNNNNNNNIYEIQEQLRRVEKERNNLQKQLLKHENNTAEYNRTLEEEKKEIEEQLMESRQRLQKEQFKFRETKMRMEMLEETVEQLEREKELLQKEIKELKRDQINRSQSYIEERRMEEEVLQLRSELNRVITEHSSVRAAMESQASDILAQNSILISEKQEYKERMDHKDQQIASLQRNNDTLKREVFELQQKILSSSPPSTIMMNGTHNNNNNNNNSNNKHMKELEDTVVSMTAELNAVERRMSDLSARFQEERKQIISQFEEERKRYKAERQECDTLVERMANELEQLAMDNRSLRASASLKQL